MSNYPFHQSFSFDLAAFDADTYSDPFDAMVEDEEFGPDPAYAGMCFDEICRDLALDREAVDRLTDSARC
jgi:hypothetical protein